MLGKETITQKRERNHHRGDLILVCEKCGKDVAYGWNCCGIQY